MKMVNSERLWRFIVLAFIVSVAFAVNLWLVAQDNRPPPWDYATYLSRSLAFYGSVRRGSLSEFFSVFRGDLYRPPLVPLAALPFYAMFGTGYQSAMLVNLVFIAILILSTYKLGEVLHSSRLGLVAAGIVSTLPGVITYERVFGLDFPTTALVSAGLYLTVASEGFRKRGVSIALGAVIGLGMLTKWSYFVFVTPMILAELIQSFSGGFFDRHFVFLAKFKSRRAINFPNLILCGLVAAGISSTWYVDALRQGLTGRLTRYALGAPHESGSWSNLFGLLYQELSFYPSILFTHYMGSFYGVTLTLLSIFGLAFVQGRVNSLASLSARSTRSIAFSFLISLFAFSLLTNKDTRFFLPALPPLVVLLVCTGWKIRMRHIRLGSTLLVGVLLCGSLISVNAALQPTVGTHYGIYVPWTISQTMDPYEDWSPPKSHDWKLEQILELIVTLDPQANVGILASHWVFNQDTLRYYAVRSGFDSLSFRDFRDSLVVPPYDDLKNYNFILMKTGDVGPGWLTKPLSTILDRLRNPEDPFYTDFEMIRSYDLPDGSQLFVFMRKTSQLSFETTHPYQTPLCCQRLTAI